jgi:hypothetical protein
MQKPRFCPQCGKFISGNTHRHSNKAGISKNAPVPGCIRTLQQAVNLELIKTSQVRLF